MDPVIRNPPPHWDRLHNIPPPIPDLFCRRGRLPTLIRGIFSMAARIRRRPPGGGYAAQGYQAGFGLLLVAQAVAFLWFLAARYDTIGAR